MTAHYDLKIGQVGLGDDRQEELPSVHTLLTGADDLERLNAELNEEALHGDIEEFALQL